MALIKKTSGSNKTNPFENPYTYDSLAKLSTLTTKEEEAFLKFFEEEDRKTKEKPPEKTYTVLEENEYYSQKKEIDKTSLVIVFSPLINFLILYFTMKQISLKNLGYFTFIISQFFRYLIIIFLMTLTGGVGVLFLYFFEKLIPFKISLYPNYKDFIQNKISLNDLYIKWRKKLKYAIILTSTFFFIYLMIIINYSEFEVVLYTTIFLILLLLFISPLFIYLKKIKQEHFEELHFQTSNQETKYGKSNNFIEVLKNKNKNSDKLKKYLLKSKLIYTKTIEKLTSDEIIIISIILGSITFLIFGNLFGVTQYFDRKGNRIYSEDYDGFSKIDFNYVTAIIGFIVITGISYIYLNRKSSKTN
jgi:hypothetical protein